MLTEVSLIQLPANLMPAAFSKGRTGISRTGKLFGSAAASRGRIPIRSPAESRPN
ncbi:MAG: hypothetical protein QGF00_09910 [Planctomycetota bacterium]|nr:hypothetical protein [Planctomycetota bacterium]